MQPMGSNISCPSTDPSNGCLSALEQPSQREKIRPNDLGLFGHRWRGCSEAAVCFGASPSHSPSLLSLPMKEVFLCFRTFSFSLLVKVFSHSQLTSGTKNTLCGKTRGWESIPAVHVCDKHSIEMKSNTDSKKRSFLIEEEG